MATQPRDKKSMIRPFVVNIRQALNKLPSDVEKEELEAGCTTIIKFLADLKDNIANMPSAEELASVQQQIQRMEEFLDRAEHDPVLKAALGLRKSASKKHLSTIVTESDKEKARKALSAFDSIQLDEIRLKLGDESSYSMRELRAIATEMGIKSIQRLSHVDLVHRITTKIANFRGYQSLGGAESVTE